MKQVIITLVLSTSIALIGCCILYIFADLHDDKTEEQVEEPKKIEYGVESIEELKDMAEWEIPSEFVPIDCSLDEDVQRFTYYLCEANGISFEFMMAVMYCESGYDASAISSTNDYGLCQINKMNHEWLSETLGITDFLDPYQNVIAGVYIFRNLFEKYDDPSMVLMAYNMGESGASRLWKQGVYESYYSSNVMEALEKMGDSL